MTQCGARSIEIEANRFGGKCTSGGDNAGGLLSVATGRDMDSVMYRSPAGGQKR